MHQHRFNVVELRKENNKNLCHSLDMLNVNWNAIRSIHFQNHIVQTYLHLSLNAQVKKKILCVWYYEQNTVILIKGSMLQIKPGQKTQLLHIGKITAKLKGHQSLLNLAL